jgi:hypothetical protein
MSTAGFPTTVPSFGQIEDNALKVERMARELEAVATYVKTSATSSNATLDIDLTGAILAAGTPMAAFADNAGASAPGVTLADSKCMGIRWNNQAGQTAVFTRFTMPADMDITANAYLKVEASKTGNTVGDATKFTIACYNNVVGALHDADADFGGDTSAMTGDAAAKTLQEVSLTLALANLAATGSNVTMSIKPKDGTLGTDDVIVSRVQLVYKRKPLA